MADRKNRQDVKLQEKSLHLLNHVNLILDELRTFWPLTVRQIYYQLVSGRIIANNIKEYNRIQRPINVGRMQGIVPWEAIEDRSRSSREWQQWNNQGEFIQEQKEDLLKGYSRDLLQTQDSAFEIWVEKDALSEVVGQVASRYGIMMVVNRGFCSLSFSNECRNRVDDREKPTFVFYLGDHDPSGLDMFPSQMITLQDEMNLGERITGKHIALTHQQAVEMELPTTIDAIKWGDTRAKAYADEYGTDAWELDAVPPGVLQEILTTEIESRLNLDALQREREIQVEDRDDIDELRDELIEKIEE